ncbi:hypothetical protein V7113_28030 [Priestia megaterium]|uniref:hypothetical protein n=1 Tax=Priestia megaterium TaxID=1404 RepID=UPI002FFF3665
MENESQFVSDEYRGITVKSGMQSVWRDGYKSFGWELKQSKPVVTNHIFRPIMAIIAPLAILPASPFLEMLRQSEPETKIDLLFGRDRDIRRKAQMNHLQYQFEHSVKEITRLEESSNKAAFIASCTIGMIGTICMACSMFSYLIGILELCAVLAVPGFLGWVLPYFLYKGIKRKKKKKIAPLVEKQYETIHEVCKKARSLI